MDCGLMKDHLRNIVSFLSEFMWIIDSYVSDFFLQDLSRLVPVKWWQILSECEPEELAALLDRRTWNASKVWPLSLLAFRGVVTRWCLASEPLNVTELAQKCHPENSKCKTPVIDDRGVLKDGQYLSLEHCYRKHVKPKKQHEIVKLAEVIRYMCDLCACDQVVDVGAGQGHLARLLSFGYGVQVTTVEGADCHAPKVHKYDKEVCDDMKKGGVSARRKKKQKSQSNCTQDGSRSHYKSVPQKPVSQFNPELGGPDSLSNGTSGGPDSLSNGTSGGPDSLSNGTSRGHDSLSNGTSGGPDLLSNGTSGGPDLLSNGTSGGLDSLSNRNSGGHDSLSNHAFGGPLSDAHLTQSNWLKNPQPKHVVARIDPAMPVDDFMQTLTLRTHAGQQPETLLGSEPQSSNNERENSTISERFGDHVAGGDRVAGGDHVTGDEARFVLTGLHACGDLTPTIIRMFVACPQAVGLASVGCCYMKLSPAGKNRTDGAATGTPLGYPMSEFTKSLQPHHLSYEAREMACHFITAYQDRLKNNLPNLRSHAYRAALQEIIQEKAPHIDHGCIKLTLKDTHRLPFQQYAEAALNKLNLDPTLSTDLLLRASDRLDKWSEVVAYYTLRLSLAPLIETAILLDRVLYLREQGVQCRLVPIFDPKISPRNVVLLAEK